MIDFSGTKGAAGARFVAAGSATPNEAARPGCPHANRILFMQGADIARIK
jgi:hypothetical protein